MLYLHKILKTIVIANMSFNIIYMHKTTGKAYVIKKYIWVGEHPRHELMARGCAEWSAVQNRWTTILQ